MKVRRNFSLEKEHLRMLQNRSDEENRSDSEHVRFLIQQDYKKNAQS